MAEGKGDQVYWRQEVKRAKEAKGRVGGWSEKAKDGGRPGG